MSWLTAKIILIDVITVERVLVTERVVDVRRTLINIHRSRGRSNKAIRDDSASNDGVRVWYQAKNGISNGIPTSYYCGALCLGENIRAGRQTLTMAQALIAQEEIGFSLLDGSAEIRTELVALEWRDWVRRPRLRWSHD